MSNFEVTGTINLSPIEAGLRRLESQLSSLRAPPIQITAPNTAAVNSALSQISAKTVHIKSQIDPPTSIGGGLSSFLNAERGNMANVGRELGQSLQMGMQQQFGMMGGMAATTASALGPIGIAAGAATVAVIGLGAASVNAARQWETLMSGVGKTAGLSQGTAQFNALSESLLQLSKTAGMGTQSSLATIAQMAGSQGIGAKAADAGNYELQRQQILAYTKDVQSMATAFDMSAEDSATMGAAVQKSFKLPMDEIHHMGSMVTTVGDSVGVQEKKILDFLSRAGGSRIAVNEGVTKTAAFGSALMSTGMQAEIAASAITMMESQVLGNDEKMGKWAKTLGVTKDALWEMTKTDFYGTVLKTGDLMSKMDLSKSIPMATEIFGPEVAKYVSKMGGVGDDYAMGVEKGNKAMIEGTRLAAVFGEKGATVDSKWQAFSNTLNTAFIHMGNAALPAIGSIIDSMASLVNLADKFGVAISKGVDWIGSGASNLVAKAAPTAQSAFDFLNKFGYNEMGSPETKSKIANTLQGGSVQVPATLDFSNGISDSYEELDQAGAEAGKTWSDSFESAVKVGVNPIVAALKASGVDELSAMKMAASQTPDTKEQSTEAIGSFYNLMDKFSLSRTTGNAINSYASISGPGVNESMLYGGIQQPKYDSVIKEFEEKYKNIILDMPKYMSTVKDDTSKVFEGILADGVVKWDEQGQLKDILAGLKEIQQIDPVSFKLAGLEEKRAELKAALDGVNVEIGIDKEQFETNFGLWLAENKALFQQDYKVTGDRGDEATQRKRFEYESEIKRRADAGDKNAARIQEVLKGMEDVIASGDVGAISASAEAANNELLKLDPNLGKASWYIDILNTATATLTTSETVAEGSFYRASAAADILAGSLQRAASSVASRPTGISSPYATSGYNEWMGQSPFKYSGQKVSAAIASPYMGLDNNIWNNIPKLASGGRVKGGQGGLAFIGEGGVDEYVIPVDQIPGLYPKVAHAQKGTIGYYLNERPFEDSYRMTGPVSYQWSKYPAAPGVMFSGTEQTAWLADKQMSGTEYLSNAIRDLQLKSIGNSLVKPWFARGETETPKFLVDALMKLSPQHESTWNAQRGGTVPAIGKDTAESGAISDTAKQQGLTVRDAWYSLYGESFTEGCISANAPDPSLIFTPSASLISEIGRTMGKDASAAWNQLYGDSFTEGCIGANAPDSLLKFTPSARLLAETGRAQGGAWGSQAIGGSSNAPLVSGLDKFAGVMERSGTKFEKSTDRLAKITSMPGILGGTKSLSFSTSGDQSLVVGKTASGYLGKYDPRTDTCEMLDFAAPNPGMITNDPFYLGLTKDSPAWKPWEEGGWGGLTAQTNDPQLRILQEQARQAAQTAKNTKEIERNTGDLKKDMSAMVSGGQTSAGNLIAGAGGVWGMNGGMGGSYGTFFGWGADSGPGSIGVPTGGEYQPDWGSWGGGGDWMNQAEGGIVDGATPIIFGEAGREAFVPIADRAAGLRILPRVMQELGVRTFAKGGFAGGSSSNISAAIGGNSFHIHIHEADRKTSKQIAREVSKQIQADLFKARKG